MGNVKKFFTYDDFSENKMCDKRGEQEESGFVDERFKDNIKNFFADIWKTGRLSDFTIVAGSSKYLVHKFVLSMQSKAFEEKITELFEQNSREIIIEKFTPETLEEFIRYLYTGSLSGDVDLEQLLEMSTVYKVPQLEQFCKNLLSGNSENFLINVSPIRSVNKLCNIQSLPKVQANFLNDNGASTSVKTKIVPYKSSSNDVRIVTSTPSKDENESGYNTKSTNSLKLDETSFSEPKLCADQEKQNNVASSSSSTTSSLSQFETLSTHSEEPIGEVEIDFNKIFDLPHNTPGSAYQSLMEALDLHFKHLNFTDKNCPQCDFVGQSISKVKRHFVSFHTNINFKCPVDFCTKRSLTKNTIEEHCKDVEKNAIDSPVHSDTYKLPCRKGLSDESDIEVLECDGGIESFESMIESVIDKISKLINKFERKGTIVEGLQVGYGSKFANKRQTFYHQQADYIRRSCIKPNIKISELILGKFKTYQIAFDFESFLINELLNPSSELGEKFGKICRNVYDDRKGPDADKEGIGIVYFVLFSKKKDRLRRNTKKPGHLKDFI